MLNNPSFSFQPISNADFIVPVEIDGTVHQVYVLKRPFVDEFLKKMGELFECVLFTASLAKVTYWTLCTRDATKFHTAQISATSNVM